MAGVSRPLSSLDAKVRTEAEAVPHGFGFFIAAARFP
jgi:hypothetical protein